MSDKQIKIAFVVDDTSAAKAKKSIDELTSSLERLAKASHAAGGGGITTEKTMLGQGGSAHAGASGSAKAGSAPVGQQKKGGILAGIFGDTDSSSIGRFTTAATSAFSRVSSGIKTFVNSASQDVSKLNASIESLNKSMGSVRGGSGGVVGGGGATMGGGRGGAGTAGGVSPQAAVLNAPAAAAAAGRGAAPQQQRRAGVVAALTPLVGEATGGVGSGLMGAMGRFTPIGLGIAAAGMLYNTVADQSQKTKIAQLDYSLNEPGRDRERIANLASMYGGNASRIIGGDINLVTAMRLANADKKAQQHIADSVNQQIELTDRQEGRLDDNKLKQLGRSALDKTGAVAANATRAKFTEKIFLKDKTGTARLADEGLTPSEINRRLGVSNSGRSFYKAGVLGSNVVGSSPLVRITDASSQEIGHDQAVKNAQMRVATEQQKLIEQHRATISVYQSTVANELYGGAMSTIGSARRGFRSAGDIVDPKTGEVIGDKTLGREANLMKMGLTMGEVDATRAGIVGAGMGYLGNFSDTGLTMAGLGGLQGIPGIIRAGGVMGGSVKGAKNMYAMAQSLISGRGGAGHGLDTTVGSELFQQLGTRGMGLAAGGGLGMDGNINEFIRGSAGVIAGNGQDVGAQQRTMMMLNTGVGQMNEMMSGSKAGFYAATNMASSVHHAGGFGLLSDKLGKMSFEELTSISRGGDISSEMKKLGMTQSMASGFLKDKIKTDLFAEKGFLATGDLKETKDRFLNQYGGDLDTMLSKEAGSDKSKEASIMESLGLVANGGLPSILALRTMGAKAAKGKGVSTSGLSGAQKSAIDAQRTIKGEINEAYGINSKDIKKDFGDAPAAVRGEAAKQAAAAGQMGAISDISTNTQLFAKNLEKLVKAMVDNLERLNGGKKPAAQKAG